MQWGQWISQTCLFVPNNSQTVNVGVGGREGRKIPAWHMRECTPLCGTCDMASSSLILPGVGIRTTDAGTQHRVNRRGRCRGEGAAGGTVFQLCLQTRTASGIPTAAQAGEYPQRIRASVA